MEPRVLAPRARLLGDGQPGTVLAQGPALPPSEMCSPLPFPWFPCADASLLLQFYVCAAESCTEPAVLVHYKHTVFAFLTCFVFASHLPERLAPGHFDYIGECQKGEVALLPHYFQEESTLMHE